MKRGIQQTNDKLRMDFDYEIGKKTMGKVEKSVREIACGKSIDQLSNSESYDEDDTIFYTSTPKQPKFFLRQMWKKPPDKPRSGLQQVAV